MIKQYFIQAIAQLRMHPLISCITIIATSLSILLIMIVVMFNQVKVAPFSPESNRDRFLHVTYSTFKNKDWGEDSSSNGPMSLKTAKECYKSLITPEVVTIYTIAPITYPLSLPSMPAISAEVRETDADYWKVFDFKFLEGSSYSEADVLSSLPVAVITESISQSLFGTKSGVTGREFLFNYAPCRVAGVVKNVSPLATKAYAQVWIPYGSLTNVINNNWAEDNMGMVSATILAKKRGDFTIIREECIKRVDDYNKALESTGFRLIDRNRPYDQEKTSLEIGANIEPDMSKERQIHFIMYAILILVPAINLSSMTHSRLRQRVSEIGIRRAFGCTRAEIIWQIIFENLIVSLIAGILGLILCISITWLAADSFFKTSYTSLYEAPLVDSSVLIHPSTFVYALSFCFILNLLSSGIPAWRASRSGIVYALSGK